MALFAVIVMVLVAAGLMVSVLVALDPVYALMVKGSVTVRSLTRLKTTGPETPTLLILAIAFGKLLNGLACPVPTR